MGSFALVVERFPDDPNESAPKTLKALRVLDSALKLKDAKALAVFVSAHLPCAIAMGIEEQRARTAAEAFNDAGGSARVVPSDAMVAMLAHRFP